MGAVPAGVISAGPAHGADRSRCSRDLHDRVRETIVAHLEPASLASHHHRLAQALSSSGQADPEALAIHYESAGEPGMAGEYYGMAAARAVQSLAFDREVKLLQAPSIFGK